MFFLTKQLVRSLPNVVLNKNQFVRTHKGGIPGCNLPFRKSMDNPMRLTAVYFLVGALGFGSPWLLTMHIMLKPYDYVVDEEE